MRWTKSWLVRPFTAFKQLGVSLARSFFIFYDYKLKLYQFKQPDYRAWLSSKSERMCGINDSGRRVLYSA